MSKYLLLFLLPIQVFNTYAQQPFQNIRGTVVDIASNSPISFANIVIVNLNKGAISDTAGKFHIPGIPTGRYEIRISALAYETLTLKEIEVNASKEVLLSIALQEKLTSLSEVVIKPKVNKESSLNPMASVSAKMLSVEEARRYAGAFDDPARLVSAFAGVSSNVNNNAIVVRGNSPKSLQWKLEGVEIANPNHFADLSAFGGGGLSALSSQCLANSDFFSAAFPAEYNNALSGVFDMYMRIGNTSKREHTFQLGLTGIDFAMEGPFQKGSQSSYLFNYRYSSLALLEPILPDNAGAVRYQDLSFKFNFVSPKAGTFSIWGIALLDGSGQSANTDSATWEIRSDRQTADVKQYMSALGLNHTYLLNTKSYLKSTLALSSNGIDLTTDYLNPRLELVPENKIQNNTLNAVLSSILQTKFSNRHSNKIGFTATQLRYGLLFKNSFLPGQALQTLVDEQGDSFLLSLFSSSAYNISQKLRLNIGLNAQLFTLNHAHTFEPRLGLVYRSDPSQTFSLAYGLHSRLERINYYFVKNPADAQDKPNKDLDFTQSHHLVLGYGRSINENVYLKIETYYQYLFNVPVIKDSSFSFLNLQNDWFFNSALTNTGTGRNYGIDISLDKYISNGLYAMFTASVFNSEYQGGDKIWRNTRYNRNFAFNFLVGKEWFVGINKLRTVGLNARLSYQGGDRFSPIDQAESRQNRDVVFDERKAFSEQIAPSFTSHFTLLYKVNKAKTTREIAFKILNANMFREFYGFQYNFKTQQVTEQREAIIIPNLSYKIEF